MQHEDPTAQAKNTATNAASPRAAWLADLEANTDAFLSTLATLDALSQRQGPLLERAERDLAVGENGDPEAIPNSDAVAALLDVLSERESLLNQLGPRTERLQALRERFERERGLVEEPDRVRVQRKLEGIKSVAAAIGERDRKDESRLDALRDVVVREISGLQRSRRAAAGYAKPAPARPTFHDAEG